MKIYINDNGEIKDVNETENESLTEVEVTDGTFDGWSVARMLCYRVEVQDGNVTMFTPYIDTRIVEQLDKQGVRTESLSTDVLNTQDALAVVFEGFDAESKENESDITNLQDAIATVYEMLTM